MSIDTAEWQLRHSSESLAPMRAHSRSARYRLRSRKASRVEIEPKMWPQTSLEACIFRAIFRVHSCGTWQSGQPARTPDRLVKWMVPCSSSKTLLRISWQLTQNSGRFVASSAVLKPPQNPTPATKPPSVRKARLKPVAGEVATLTSFSPQNEFQSRRMGPRPRGVAPAPPPPAGEDA